MSGAGRGTPRISPAFGADPIVANLNIPAGQSAEVISLGDGKWCYSLTPSGAALSPLDGTFTDFTVTPLIFPAGSTRGLLEILYDPADGTSQLETKVLYEALIPDPTGGVFSLGGTPTFPAAGFPLGAELLIAAPVYKTQVSGAATAFSFGLPICIPAGCPGGLTAQFREIGTTGGSVNITRLRTDNFGC